MTARPPFDPERWWLSAACRSVVPVNDFYVARGAEVPPHVVAVCARCPAAVHRACLEDALATSDNADQGYRAGTSAKERRKIRARRRRLGGAA